MQGLSWPRLVTRKPDIIPDEVQFQSTVRVRSCVCVCLAWRNEAKSNQGYISLAALLQATSGRKDVMRETKKKKTKLKKIMKCSTEGSIE